MTQSFLEVSIEVASDFADILIAELDQNGFDSFEETETGIKAFIPEEDFDKEILHEIQQQYEDLFEFHFSVEPLEKKNWNEEWEKNFEQTIVNDECIIRASFHQPEKEYRYEIIINPRMSFGTGHHATTTMMLLHELDMDLKGKSVLDAGCGTGVLAIMAAKKEASRVMAYDIDEWSYDNSLDNFTLNECDGIELALGDVSTVLDKGPFDVVLANINKNILLQDIPSFASIVTKNGYLVLSGFYEKDVEDLLFASEKEGFVLDNQKEKSGWASLRLKKIN